MVFQEQLTVSQENTCDFYWRHSHRFCWSYRDMLPMRTGKALLIPASERAKFTRPQSSTRRLLGGPLNPRLRTPSQALPKGRAAGNP